jgi:hypothetical protein
MANHMETYITINNGDIKVAEKLKEIFTPDEGEYSVGTEDLVKRIFGETAPEEYDYDWYVDNIGTKWVYSEYDHDDDCEAIHLILTSAWSVPQGLLERLAKVLSEIKSDCYISGTYEDESYDPCGAFIYAGDYNDIEDWDAEFDWDKYEEDDFYLEVWRCEYMSLESELVEVYLDYLRDKAENPEDYI